MGKSLLIIMLSDGFLKEMKQMKYVLCLFFILFSIVFVKAQDTIYKSDSSVQIVKVIEVNEFQIKYKLYSDSAGLTHVISNENINKIVYFNGSIKEFKQEANNNLPQNKIDPRITDFGRNNIYLNLLDLLFSTATIGYELTSKSGKFGFKFPITINPFQSFDYTSELDNIYYSKQKIVGTGLVFLYYPFGQGSVKFFMGPSFDFCLFQNYEKIYEPGLNYSNKFFIGKVGRVYSALFEQGFLFQLAKHVSFSINAKIGYSKGKGIYHYNFSDFGNGVWEYSDQSFLSYSFGIDVGYKF